MKHLGSLESTQEARVAPNFRHASYRYLDESTLVHEQIVNFNLKLSFQTILIFFAFVSDYDYNEYKRKKSNWFEKF